MPTPARAAAAALLFIAIVAACGGSDKSTGPVANGGCNSTPTGTMSAQINGASWTADFQTTATVNANLSIVQVAGLECPAAAGASARSMSITLGRLTPITPGTYPLDPASQGVPAGSGYSGIANYVSAPNLWYSNLSDASGGGSGSITFTTVSATRLTGTFQYVAVAPGSNAANARGRTTVTSGSFNIPVR